MEQLFASPLLLQDNRESKPAGRRPWLFALLPALCLILLLTGASPAAQADPPALAPVASPTDPLPDKSLFAIGAPAAIQAQPAAPASPVLFDCTGVSEIPQAECQVLVALYNSTNGINWNNKTGWLVTNTPCSWYGVLCASGHVTQLNLGSNQLSGSIPSQLGNLANLQWLYLYSNQLSGSIPPQLSNLANLQGLWLYNNQLSGSIPPELGNLANLRELYLYSNQLSGSIPPQLGNLANLQELLLDSNQLSGSIPPELGNLASLQGLWLYSNQLSGSIPPELGNLANLQWLYLGFNQLSGSIPSQLGDLVSLQYLDLSFNQLSRSIPPELGNLANLRELYLFSNQLSGSIPPQLGNLTSLQQLYLNGNQLSESIPPELGNLANLQGLNLGFNQLSGSIPPELGNLASLQVLSLSSNRLSGSIPPQLGNLASLRELYLHSSQLSGGIPSQLCNPVNLTYLDLGYNKLISGPACIDSKDPDWAQTQTVPPINLQATPQSGSSVQLTWTPSLYTGDGGFYEVWYATSAGGSYVLHGTTSNKSATGYLAGNLTPGITYYFRVRTYTPAHNWSPAYQQNTLWSDYTQEVSAAPWTPTPTHTPTNTPTRTHTPTHTPTNTPTPTPTNTPTHTPTNTPTHTPTNTLTPTYTPANTPTRTHTPPHTPTNTPAWTHTPTTTWTPTWTRPPTLTPTPTSRPTDTPTRGPSPTATPRGDDYEPDDACTVANAIQTDGSAQQHTFHVPADADWVRFWADAGRTYTLQTARVGPQADTVLALFDSCAAIVPLAFDDNAFGRGAHIVWTAPAGGLYYLRVNNRDPNAAGRNAAYELSVRLQPRRAAAIIVGGHDDGYRLQCNITNSTNRAYNTFLAGGLSPDDIYYLSPDPRPECTPVASRDADATSANLQHALTTWAAGKVGSDAPLYLYMMDHGGEDVFLINGSGDTVTAGQLDAWLSGLETTTQVSAVNVVIEACRSGSFIERAPEIAKAGRVVITSAAANQNAYASPDGAIFSDAFFPALQESQDLCTGFQAASQAVQQTGLWQTPWLDANGNSVPNEAADCELARGLGLAAAFAERPPVIDAITVPLSISGPAGIIRAAVRDDVGVARVWAVLYPPSFVEPPPGDTTPELNLPIVELTAQGNGEYVATYTGFTERGAWRVVVYAQDGAGAQAAPQRGSIWVGSRLWLPVVVKGGW
jgi:Leucine-rich repeat (LRR) protein